MKHILFIVAFLGSLNAYALYSPADCRDALSAHVWTEQKFLRLGRLDGALDGAASATLLMRVREPDAKIILPATARLTVLKDQVFTRGKDTYALIHGNADDLVERREEIAALNGGRKVSFQVLDKNEVERVTPQLSRELERRLRVLAYIKVPFTKADGWLERYKAYRDLKRYFDKETRPLREGLASRLHRSRVPDVKVAPYVLSEVRECLGSACSLPQNQADLIQERLVNFSVEIGSKLTLDEAGSLAPFTMDMLSQLRPYNVDQHEAAIAAADLGKWDPQTQTRYQRLVLMGRAWDLVEKALRGQDFKLSPPTIASMEKTMGEFITDLEKPLPVRHASFREWSHGELERELLDDRFQALRARRPYVVVGNDRDVRVVAADPDLIYSTETMSIFDQMESITQRQIGPKVRRYLRTELDFVKLTPAEARDDRRLRDLAERQQVAVVHSGGQLGNRILLIPMKVDPVFDYDSSIVAERDLRLPLLNQVILRARHRAPTLPNGDQTFFVEDPNGDAGWQVDFKFTSDQLDREHVVVRNPRKMLKKSAYKFWKAQATEMQLVDFKRESTNGPMFVYGEDKVLYVEMSSVAAVKSILGYNLNLEEIWNTLNSVEGAVVDVTTGCTTVGDLDICFGPHVGSWARITEIRRAGRN